jgi:hypothetical protein
MIGHERDPARGQRMRAQEFRQTSHIIEEQRLVTRSDDLSGGALIRYRHPAETTRFSRRVQLGWRGHRVAVIRRNGQ